MDEVVACYLIVSRNSKGVPLDNKKLKIFLRHPNTGILHDTHQFDFCKSSVKSMTSMLRGGAQVWLTDNSARVPLSGKIIRIRRVSDIDKIAGLSVAFKETFISHFKITTKAVLRPVVAVAV
jgi:hypothetical protein